MWRPVDNPISRRTDQTKSVTSEPVTHREVFIIRKCIIQRGYSTERNTSVVKSLYFLWSPALSTLNSHRGVSKYSACNLWSLTSSHLTSNLLSLCSERAPLHRAYRWSKRGVGGSVAIVLFPHGWWNGNFTDVPFCGFEALTKLKRVFENCNSRIRLD